MSNNLKAGVVMVVAVTLLTLNDGIAKHLSDTLSVAQILFYRGLFATAALVIAVKASGHSLLHRRLLDRWVLTRGGLDVCCTVTFLFGLTLLPIAIATTLVFVSPIIVTLLAATVLREQVGWRRWSAVFAGFAGVVTIMGLGAQPWSYAMLLPLLAALLLACRDLVTRKVSADIPTIQVALVTSVCVTLAGLVGIPFSENAVAPVHFAWLSLMGLMMCCFYFGHITAVRLGELSFIAPLVYTSILVALGLGVIVWNDTVSWQQLAGIALVVASGVVIFVREGARGQRSAPPFQEPA
ncbi:MAG: DMT family transporter [Gammaproteobacteria bacterium]